MNQELNDQTESHRASELERALAFAFEKAGWQIKLPDHKPETLPYDLIVESPSVRYVIELKMARDARRQALQSLLADALLRARAAAKQHQAQPLAIVAAPSLSDKLVSELREYMETYAPGDAYGFVDMRGRLELVGPQLNEVQGTPDLDTKAQLKVQKPVDMFSDLNQWLLKVLLAPKLPDELLGAPRKTIHNAADLARVANVSVPTATRLASHLKQEGFLTSTRRGLELVRVRELLYRWRTIRSTPVREVTARFVLSASDPERKLYKSLSAFTEKRLASWSNNGVTWAKPPRTGFAQFSACSMLGFGFVSGVPATIYLEDIGTETLKELGLRAVEPGEAVQVLLQVPRYTETAFRGMTVSTGVPTTDVIQSWLDVSNHPARGQEQADLIWDRILSQM